MRMDCRSFNEQGMSAAASILEDLRVRPEGDRPVDLLADPGLTEIVGASLELPNQSFASRWLLAVWLYRELGKALPNTAQLHVPGFWTWLAFFLLPIIRPPGTKVGEDARYILNKDDYRKRYRHLVAGPYYVFLAHESEPHIVRGLLATAPQAPGDLYEQFASRQELITSSAIMHVVNQMYFDQESGTLKRGASTSAHRLAAVLMQYDVTYDFAVIPPDRLMHMLPREFRRFMPT